MFSEDKVTEIFYLADEFCKFFNASQEKSMLEAPKDGKKHRRKPNRMSDAEIIVILIHFHSGGFRCFKHYYLHYICKHCKKMFPNTVSYNRFVELEKEVLLQLTVFIKQVLLGECTGISFVDSTPLRVCRNQLLKRAHCSRTSKGNSLEIKDISEKLFLKVSLWMEYNSSQKSRTI